MFLSYLKQKLRLIEAYFTGIICTFVAASLKLFIYVYKQQT